MSIVSDILESLVEQASFQGELESDITHISPQIIKHLIKCYLWRDSQSLKHWEDEVHGFLDEVPRMKSSKSKYPKQRNLYKWLWLENEVKVQTFTKNMITLAKDGKYKGTKVYRVTPELVESIKGFMSEYFLWVSDTLSREGVTDLEEVRNKINSLLEKYPLP